MKNTDKAELVTAAQLAGADSSRTFWDEVQERLEAMENQDVDRVKPRAEREDTRLY